MPVDKKNHARIKRESAQRRRQAGTVREKTPEQKARDAELGRLRYLRRKEAAVAEGKSIYSEEAKQRRKEAERSRSQWRQFKKEFDRYLDSKGIP